MEFRNANMVGLSGFSIDETIEHAVRAFDAQLSTSLTVTDFHTLRNYFRSVANKAYEDGANAQRKIFYEATRHG